VSTLDHVAVVAPDLPTLIAVAAANEGTITVPVARATEAGLTVVAEARWPESELDHTPPALPGFIVSSFSPVAAETAARCLSRRPTGSAGTAATAEPAEPVVATIAEAVVRSAGLVPSSATAVIIASTRGDLHSAAHVAAAVDAGGTLGPLLFFQSVPNAVAGHIAARWHLTGPVVCVADRVSALEAAALLIEDGDADSALVLHVEQAGPGQAAPDRTTAHAVLLRPASPATSGGQP
jgi:hypothetical protein